VVVSPDDENYIAVCATDNSTVYISDDAGANWDSLGAPTGVNSTSDLAISPEKSGKHTIALALDDGGNGEIWTYEIGAVGAGWAETSALGSDFWVSGVAGAVAFSPNFASDQVMVAVTENASQGVYFQIFSFNQDLWNAEAGAFDGYPFAIVEDDTDSTVDGHLDSASIAMAPDYLGSDDSMRVCFVGITTDGTASGDDADGIFRLENDDVEALKEDKNIHSVDFDGSRLVAGRYDAIDIYRSSDPLSSSPSVSGSTSSKEPGGDEKVVAAFAGADVVAGTSGAESCFSVSTDDGKTFNDISLIDTTLAVLSDVAVNEDGSKIYLVTGDEVGASGNVSLSVWRYESRWERIYSKQSKDDDFIIRLAPDDDDVIYLADVEAKTIYYSTDGGATKWQTRTSRYDITDLAVEGDGGVAYVMTDNGYVSKSTNTGFTWDSKVSSKLTAGSSMLTSLGEDLLLGGSSDGYVSYSTNGNSSWSLIDDDIGGIVQVTATGLADGDFLLAASDTANDYIYNLEVGEDDEWNKITAEDFIADGYKVYGVALAEGVFYAVGANATGNISQLYRTLTPTSDDPTWSSADSAGEQFDVTPSALRVSVSDGITKLWTINSDAMTLFSYKDSLAINGPALTAPADAFKVTVNPVTGRASQLIFSWESLSDNIEEWDFVIATDAGFDESIISEAVVTAADAGDIVSQVVGPYVTGDFGIDFMPNTTYYWRVRVDAAGPVRSQWSEVRSFDTGDLEVFEPVVIEQPPAPVISVPSAPEITLEVPEIVMPAYPEPAPAPEIVIPPSPEPVAPIPAYALWAIIIIGAVLVIAMIILIMRTRRPV